ncbi:MAG: alkaline phosphatase family protein [Verrucomicrobiales bacterium]|nr:alkaline phosphatase family protein [Verrucomicrobiales bacterium]
MRFLIILLLLSQSVAAEEPLTRILFGSCIKQENPIPILETVLSRKPELFLFLGDNVYADTDDMNEMRKKYAKLGNVPAFQKLREVSQIMAVWDDHDYGRNDAGAEYPMRAEAQEVFREFWDRPDNPDREGVYDSKIFGPVGKRVQVILLDTRYFRGPLKTGERRTGGKYYPTEDASISMLGEKQWLWLEKELRKPAEIRLIGSGIQIVPEAAGQETWSNLPNERQRLFDLIAETKAEGVILLSGDRHWSEFSRVTENAPYPLYDFTSSSLNQIHPRGTPTENRFRVSETTYHKENFGEIEIDWAGEETSLTVSIRDLVGKVKIAERVLLTELRSPGE